MTIEERIEAGRIVPIISLEDAADAAPLCRALEAGGLKTAEITFRTPAARDAIALVAREFPDFALGAGTVTTVAEVDAAKAAGAQFAVSPGFNPRIVDRAKQVGLPFFPGVCTPSEIEAALERGLTLLKFFPASNMGGPAGIKAVHAPYAHRGVRFIALGGVKAENVKAYLDTPGVVAAGGSWIADKAVVAEKDWTEIERRARKALAALET